MAISKRTSSWFSSGKEWVIAKHIATMPTSTAKVLTNLKKMSKHSTRMTDTITYGLLAKLIRSKLDTYEIMFSVFSFSKISAQSIEYAPINIIDLLRTNNNG
jgi:hypothetical protein